MNRPRALAVVARLTRALSCSLLALLCIPGGAQPPPAVLDKLSLTVVQVRGTGCRGGDRLGSGFVWPDRGRVVTALHVVEHCTGLTVYYQGPGALRAARIERTLAAADLAQLQVTEVPAAATVAILAEAPAKPADELMALGFRLAAPKMASTKLSVPWGSTRLEDLLPDSVRQSLSIAGVPSLSLTVLPLDGHLLPGHSGAPIFNASGQVVAMGDGGLERGAASISWGVPAAQIRQLPGSGERLMQLGAGSAVHFALDTPASSEDETLSCGQLQLTKARTRTFKDMVRTSDDPAGLQSFANLWGLAGLDLGDEPFDVYRDLRSGATVVVPAGALVEEGPEVCTVELLTPGHAVMLITGQTVRGQAGVAAAVKGLHQRLYGSGGLVWRRDPAFSYPSSQQRLDGLEVLRQSFTGYEVVPVAAQQRRMSFESVMVRRSVFLGVAAMSFEGAHLTPDKVLLCSLMPADAHCQALLTHIRQFALLMTATYLSTFAVG